ncbi:hypothetical protein DPMN_016389 [Dreissena polymorpha]|uniref:Uncharacterized protein n=1 Tax=Dreissena polymorpha TaxID=45954 RepID=A0A9D4S4J8_DREPO|nr:hypothetical protein DPMN_016389 [Dreissena polymorpha]
MYFYSPFASCRVAQLPPRRRKVGRTVQEDCMEGFRRKRAQYFQDIRGVLIMLMEIPNGSRAGEFVELRVCILPFHTFNPFIHSLITICAYKSGVFIALQFKHVQHAQPSLGGLHCTVSIDAHKTAKWGRYAYFHLEREVMELLRSFCDVALKVAGAGAKRSAGFRPRQVSPDLDQSHIIK